ncbi:Rieske (2Fe-2S) protein [Rhodococcoides corynebacterioides]|uniref:Rieske (2Fe-2S) protein n=1 Tax=Rhodococcoides corynebacterioides TaxID=53972 RepID=UPI003F7F80E7
MKSGHESGIDHIASNRSGRSARVTTDTVIASLSTAPVGGDRPGYVAPMSEERRGPDRDDAVSADRSGVLPPVLPADPIRARGRRLVEVSRLGDHRVVEVRTEDGVDLAVGMLPDGTPFAVGNVCRHQLAKLGRGRVTDDGCLECPWHRAEYDVRTGKMVTGPQGMLFDFPLYFAGCGPSGRWSRCRRGGSHCWAGGTVLSTAETRWVGQNDGRGPPIGCVRGRARPSAHAPRRVAIRTRS